jgi:DNA-binding response OmpR family regulator
MRVLLVENDTSIAEPLIDGLARYGIVADHVTTGSAAPAAAPPDVIVLGLGLPDLDSADVSRLLRRDGDPPLITIAARGDEAELVRSLRLGADDHLVRPFSIGELVTRIRALGRRAPGADPVRTYGPLAIDTRSRKIRLHGVPIQLAPKEYDLLVLLATEPGAVVDRRHILETVWEPDFFGPGKTLDFHVASLRRKLGGAKWIENRRGVGFRLVVPA